MSYYSRLKKSFEGALRLPLNNHSKYVLFSDCHRGIGNSNDNFLKNETLYLAALQHYYNCGYTYIELGDGDELWENRDINQIVEIHNTVFALLSRFHDCGRLYMIYGNHDMEKKNKLPASIILENTSAQINSNLYLTHGHQADFLNSTLWRPARFLVRYLWKPLEHLGILDPTSAAKNYRRKEKTEKRLHHFAERENLHLIVGHTHRPYLSEADSYYRNCGSCVHPYNITCMEIEHMHISLVKWSFSTKPDMSLFVKRELLAGPYALNPLSKSN